MKKKNHIIGVLIVFLLIGGMCFQLNHLRITIKSLLGYATDFINLKTNDLIKLTGQGSLVYNKNNLKDSKITGEDYVNNDLYYPYYTMLSTNEKKLYQQIYANIVEYQSTFIPIVKINKNNLENAISAVYNDHPEIFWTDLDYSYKYLENGEIVQISIHFNETMTNIEESKRKFESAANIIIEKANLLSSDYDKEKFVHDTLIEKVSYEKNAKLNQSAYSALINQSSVCAGYSKAFQYIMIQLKIPTYYVIGYAGEDHAWNIVKLSDGYYNIDVTWDDAKTTSYHYFNKTDEIFSKTHTRTELSKYLPSCTAEQYIGVKIIPDKKFIQKEEKKPQNKKESIVIPPPVIIDNAPESEKENEEIIAPELETENEIESIEKEEIDEE